MSVGGFRPGQWTGRWDAGARRFTVTGAPAGPAGTAAATLAPGVELAVDFATPRTLVDLSVRAPEKGDPSRLPVDIDHLVRHLLGDEATEELLSLGRNHPGGANRILLARTGSAGRSTDAALADVVLLSEISAQEGLPGSVRVAAALEASRAVAIAGPSLRVARHLADSLAAQAGSWLQDEEFLALEGLEAESLVVFADLVGWLAGGTSDPAASWRIRAVAARADRIARSRRIRPKTAAYTERGWPASGWNQYSEATSVVDLREHATDRERVPANAPTGTAGTGGASTHPSAHPAPADANVAGAIAAGRAACRAERRGERVAARGSWEECATRWVAVGDRTRARLAREAATSIPVDGPRMFLVDRMR